jgi:hypothetical protein
MKKDPYKYKNPGVIYEGPLIKSKTCPYTSYRFVIINLKKLKNPDYTQYIQIGNTNFLINLN